MIKTNVNRFGKLEKEFEENSLQFFCMLMVGVTVVVALMVFVVRFFNL